jgi:hypothetical protein
MRREIRVGLAAPAAVVTAVFIGFTLTACSAPAASSTAGPSPSSAGPSSASPTGSTSPGRRISLDELAQATVTLPAWPAGAIDGCPVGKFQFHGKDTEVRNAPIGPMRVGVDKLVYVDVDRDGGDETVARIFCAVQGGTAQVVAFKRDAAGAIVTLGQVVGSGSGAIHDINDLRVDPGGSIGVQVSDVGPIDGSDVFWAAQQQWRGYGWNGARFIQTGGPTSFPPNPGITDMAVSVTDLHLVAGSGGSRQGAITVTIRDNGPGKPAKVALLLLTGSALTLRTAAGLNCSARPDTGNVKHEYACTLPAPAPGSSAMYTFGYTAGATLSGAQPDGQATVQAMLTDDRGMLDRPWQNNSTKFHVLVG